MVSTDTGVAWISACMRSKFPSQAHKYFYALRFARRRERSVPGRDGALASAEHNTSGQGFTERVCNLTRLRGAETEERGRFWSGSTSEDKNACGAALRRKFDATLCATTPRRGWLERRAESRLPAGRSATASWRGTQSITGLLSFTK